MNVPARMSEIQKLSRLSSENRELSSFTVPEAAAVSAPGNADEHVSVHRGDPKTDEVQVFKIIIDAQNRIT